MRYLVNLPLIGALLCGGLMLSLTVLTTPRGVDAAMGAAYAIVYSSILFWVLAGFTLLGCTLAGGFDWLPAAGSGSRFVLVLIGFGVIVLLSLLPIGIAIETAGRIESDRWSPAAIWASRAVASGLPLVLLAYAGWQINAPESLRQLPIVRNVALAAVAALIVTGAIVSIQELARWNQKAAARMASQRVQEDEQAAAHRRAFEALTDSDPLFKWDQYTYHSSPDDIRLEALRRIAARPNLESELIAVLDSENPLWASEGVRLVADLAFTPSPALGEAVRRRLDAYAQQLTKEAGIVTHDGDKRLDYYEESRLREALAAARRLAEEPGADLRPQIRAIGRAVALYPKSDMAARFPRDAAETEKQIAARLAAPR